MVKGEIVKAKFKVKADLALFEAIQKDGRLSEERISQETCIPSTTVHYALERIRNRGFFDIKAVPRLERFQEIPLAVIGFTNVHPEKVRELSQNYAAKSEVVHLFHDKKDILLVMVDSSMDALTSNLFSIMQRLGEKPCIYITSPSIAKSSATIPNKVLDMVYGDLPDRRMRV